MSKLFAIAALACCLAAIGETRAQSPGDKAGTMAAALDKTKYKKKEKMNISVEVFVDVKNAPAIRENSAYSGIYASEDGSYSLNLSVAADGVASGSGYDTTNGADRLSYKLVNARVSGAVLTATKAYSSGRSEPFEAVFVNRTVSSGKSPNMIDSHQTEYGLGFVKAEGEWTNRIFLSSTR